MRSVMLTAPYGQPFTDAAAARRARIEAAGEARALQLTTTPRRPDDPLVRLIQETDK